MSDDLLSLSIAAGPSRPVLTTLPQFTLTLARSGLRGPFHLDGLCLDQRGQWVGEGGQFTVFVDRTKVLDGVVMKRVRPELVSNQPSFSKIDDRRKGYLRTIELEILALSHAPIRDHPNIVNIHAWGFDYPTRDRRMALPVLFMERASGSLDELLQNSDSFNRPTILPEVRYQLCLDVLEGLICLHNEQFVHGDVKPANILIFEQQNPDVPFIAKISDFGMCLSLDTELSVSYDSYHGTTDWLAPELVRFHALRTENDDVTLSKCDVFSYGLLVLSVLCCSGQAPFKYDAFNQRSAIAAAEHLLEDAAGIQRFDSALTSKTKIFIHSVLEADPSKRSDLDRHLLAFDCPAFHCWLAERRLISLNIESSRSPSFGPGTSYSGSLDFWNKLDVNVFSELEANVSPAFNPLQKQMLSGDVLFGIATATAFYHTPGFQEKYARCIAYAAEASVPAAQGIADRLLFMICFDGCRDDFTTRNWLWNAVSTGSLVAEEDLARRHPEYCREAKQVFRTSGGYNSKLTMTHYMATLICDDLRQLDVPKAREMCNQLDTADASVDPSGNTLLHYAATYGKCDVISCLIVEKGASVDTLNGTGETALYKACLSGHTAVVRRLIALGANSAIASQPFGGTCLHWLFNFAEPEMEDIAGLLTLNGADVDSKITTLSVEHKQMRILFEHFPFHWPLGTPMHWAVGARSKKAVDILLQLQADIDALDVLEGDGGQSALGMAMKRNDADMVEHLFSRGANVGWIGCQGRNIIHMLVLDPERLNREFLLPRCIWSWVNHGSSQNRLQQLKRCLDIAHTNGVQIDLRRDRSQTPLIDAVVDDDSCATLALIRAGADCNIKCPTGELPLQRWLLRDSRRLDYPELYFVVLKELLKGTRDIQTKDDLYQEAVCHFAVNTEGTDQQLAETMEILLAYDPPASINAQDRDGITPLLKVLASLECRSTKSRISLLLEKGADVEKQSHDNGDFLYYLCKNAILSDDETMDITHTLMDRFVPAQQVDIAMQSHSTSDGSTALIKAVQNGKLDTVKYLISLGVDVNITDQKKRWTVLDWALHTADIVRATSIERAIDSFGIADRAESIENHTVFDIVVSWADYPSNGDLRGTKDQYFNASAIIDFLLTKSARKANSLGFRGAETNNPFLSDLDIVWVADGQYIPAQQPFISHWTRLYEIAWNEHRGLGHMQCICCKVLERIPASLREQPFSPALLNAIAPFRPSYDYVQDLLAKC